MREITLNTAQQQAVDHIYGPLLVLAGPGTGKTQLLSARIANILKKTDANAQNILCLTFTEAAAQNMRERLAGIIKDDAYDVHINTYHGFGSDIIRQYPEYFEEINLETGEDSRLERPIDDLQRIQIVTELINKLPFSSPLIGARHYVKHVSSTISELKRGLYSPESLRDLASENLKQVRELSPKIAEHIGVIKSFPRTADKAIELFSGIEDILSGHTGLAEIAHEELEQAMAEAVEIQKSKPLTTWKNNWLTKDADNQFRFTDESQHLRMIELATIYEKYQQALVGKQLYDFDDMILRSIHALKTNDELRFNLQEKYQFILLDEFQDTNAAQFELVKQLADNPVNEGQPNIFAVGDDDQAIYAFQGARISNMLGFINAFLDVKVVNLTENYRSHKDIIHTAHNIASQIESRLHHEIEGVDKTLQASAKNLPDDATIQRHEFSGEASEYAWVASQIQSLINSGTSPSEIVVLAPKHKLLENIVPFMAANNTPISYEKREDILQTPLMRAFRDMIKLIQAAHDGDDLRLNELLPQVLSLDFYQIPVADIWKVNWAYRTRDEDRSWVEIALETESLAPHVMFYLSLGLKATGEPLEYVLDYLTGSAPLVIDADTSYTSPLKDFYFGDKDSDPLKFYESLANLSTIREHLRAHQTGEDTLLGLQDFLDFIDAHEAADQPLINTHPIAQAQESVQLMTAYKAKGLEFEQVFLLSVHDDVWGKNARGNSSKLSLPANLQHVRYQGSSEDELRRILFVAITRAKQGLYMTSHANKDNGKATEAVKYLLEFDDGEARKTTVFPESKQLLQETSFTPTETMQHIDTMWHSRHVKLDADLKSLLKPRLENYQMSPTHLNTFIDMEYGGPEQFLLNTLLRFPSAPGEDGEFGNAIHGTLDWLQKRISEGATPELPKVLAEFDKQLSRRYIPEGRMDDFRNRGHHALKLYVPATTETFARTASAEVDFKKEGVLLGEAHLAGKIDRLEINKEAKTVNIVDFKTGKPHDKWERSVKLLKYKQQLYFYKFLIEGSHTWSGYKVAEARLEFVEPDADGKILPPLQISFNDEDKSSTALTTEQETKDLIQAVWKKIKALELPSTDEYSDDFKGTQDFILSLL
jgi:DNA helicase-2/ATP-dependent DNA helicase PcrA